MGAHYGCSAASSSEAYARVVHVRVWRVAGENVSDVRFTTVWLFSWDLLCGMGRTNRHGSESNGSAVDGMGRSVDVF